MIVVCARESPRSAIISARSRKLSLYRRYQRTQSTMISWSKCRPLKSPSIFVCARQLCRSTDLPTTMLCPSGSHQSPPRKWLSMFHGAFQRGGGFARPIGPRHRSIRLFDHLEKGLHDVDRHGEDDRRILFSSDFGQRLEVAKLHRSRNAAEDLGGVDERLRGLELGFSVDDFRAAVTFRLRISWMKG